MAGIGFELKKLFKEKGFFARIRAFAYSTLVSLGPFVLCTAIISVILVFMHTMGVSYGQRELFIATIVYCFVFSQIIASGFKMIITRFIADALYKEKFEMILPSLYGTLSVVITISGIIGIVFFLNSPLHIFIKASSYILFMELIIVFVMMEYLSALKDYIKIVQSFFAGVLSVVLLSYLFLKFSSLEASLGMLISMNIGFMIIIVFLLAFLKSFYIKSGKRYYDFLIYFDKYPSLFFIAFFYTLGLYVHNFLFWNSHLAIKIANTYVYAPVYDVPSFYAFLSIMPAMVIFVVSVETSFYDKYKVYYSLITGNGNLKDIEDARKDMTRVLWSELRNIMELQLFFTLVFLSLGHYLLPRLGLTQLSMDIFNLLCLGAFMVALMMIIMLILLYFEDRTGALFISFTFLSTNAIFTFFTLRYSESLYGLGFFASSIISLMIAIIELLVYLKNINYHTFCGQPIIYIQKTGFFGRCILFFTPKKERPLKNRP